MRRAVSSLLAAMLSLLCAATDTAAVSAQAIVVRSTKVPRFDGPVQKAFDWLEKSVAARNPGGGNQILAAYAMFKCGAPVSHPFISGAIQAVVQRSSGTEYRPVGAYDHIYGAGVDAMFLADVDSEAYQPNLQRILDYIVSVQREDGSWSDGPTQPGDVSMSQYGVLGLWAAQRAGCRVPPQAFDRAADFHLKRGNPDGGWGYRPGVKTGPGGGDSTHNMTMAASGSLSIARMVLHGQRLRARRATPPPEKKFGVLEKIDPLADVGAAPAGLVASAYPDYRAGATASALDERLQRGLAWNETRFDPVSRAEHNIYFYYCVERAASINDLDEMAGRDWFTTYGDGLLSLQAADGSFNTHTGPVVGTSFALLYFMRSTRQIIDKQYGLGLQKANKGNPFGDKKSEPEPTALDQLLASIEKIDFSDPKLDAEISMASELVRSVRAIDNPEELIGQTERLKGLLEHPAAEVRRPVYWALGRTGDFKLVPLMLKGLRDPNVDVNVEAEMALRYIARKPNGLGLSTNPFAELAVDATEADRLTAATQWRNKAIRAWSGWYFERCAFDERGGLQELESLVPDNSRHP